MVHPNSRPTMTYREWYSYICESTQISGGTCCLFGAFRFTCKAVLIHFWVNEGYWSKDTVVAFYTQDGLKLGCLYGYIEHSYPLNTIANVLACLSVPTYLHYVIIEQWRFWTSWLMTVTPLSATSASHCWWSLTVTPFLPSSRNIHDIDNMSLALGGLYLWRRRRWGMITLEGTGTSGMFWPFLSLGSLSLTSWNLFF